jgi:hypothetical protein
MMSRSLRVKDYILVKCLMLDYLMEQKIYVLRLVLFIVVGFVIIININKISNFQFSPAKRVQAIFKQFSILNL